MPSTSEAHRTSIGSFHPTLLHILERKAKAKTDAAGLHTKMRRHKTANAMCELLSWLVCVSLSVVYFLSLLLLTRCMDVEKNPGPNENDWAAFMPMLQEGIERRFSQIIYCLHEQTTAISGKIDEHCNGLEQTLNYIKSDVIKLKHAAQEDRTDINELLQNRDDAHSRIQQLEKDVERLEVNARQSNLKFFGIPEPDPRDNRTDIDELVYALNYFSPSSTWKNADFVNVHRLGRTGQQHRRRDHQQQDSPRPLIITFRHEDDKVLILRDRERRERLRQYGIRMAADLTPRQRERLQHFKQQGRVAYYRNGRLHVENGYSKTSEENTSRYNSNNRSDEEGSSVTRDLRYVRHADHNDERRGIDTDDHHQPTTQTRRHHDEDHRKQQTTVSSHHQKERTPPDRHESNGGSHRDRQKCTQANRPHPLEAPWTFQEPNNHNGWGLFPGAAGAAGYYPPWGTEFGGLNTAGHCNMAFSVRPPPD